MPVLRNHAPFTRLSTDALAAWEGAASAGVSDVQHRSMAMDAGISPLDPSMAVVGHARTVRCMAGDNSALHAAVNSVEPGDVLVIDAGGYLGNALFGGLLTDAAMRNGIAGLVIDGAVRDRSDIVAAGFPVYARGIVPAGPHKDFGGELDGAIACGGVAVHAGDLVVADGDGVSIVPLDRVDEVLTAYRALVEREEAGRQALAAGGTLAELYGSPEVVDR